MRSTLVASRILPSHASPRTPYATEIGFLPIQSGLHFRRFVQGARPGGKVSAIVVKRLSLVILTAYYINTAVFCKAFRKMEMVHDEKTVP